MNSQEQPKENATKATEGGDSKPVPVKRKRSRKKAANNAAKAAVGPGQTLNSPALTDAAVLQGKDQKAVLNHVSKRKKKRRKKKPNDKNKHVVKKGKTANANATAAVGKTKLKTLTNETTDVINNITDTRFNGPSNANDTGNFGQFNNPELKVVDKSILNHNSRGAEVQAKPEIEDVQNVHPKTIDENLVKWEHLALVVEEYFLTVNNA